MTHANHQLIRDFFSALSSGDVQDGLFTDNATMWTNVSGASDKARWQGGVKMLQSLFDGGLKYRVESLTAEDDRVAAEVLAQGRLRNGEDYQNTYVFMFRIRDGRIASIAEHTNSIVVREKIVPLIQAAAAKR